MDPDDSAECSNRLTDCSINISPDNNRADLTDHTAGCSNRHTDCSINISPDNSRADDSTDHTAGCSNRHTDCSINISPDNNRADLTDHTAGCSNRHTDCSINISPDNSRADSHIQTLDSSISTEPIDEICPTDRCEFETLAREAETIESARKWRACTKNSGHPNFIPVGEFSLQHLPQECQREEVVTLVQHAAKLTVRLRANQPDPNRPAKWAIHGNQQSTGTGTIVDITESTGKCPCADCRSEAGRGERWWCLGILTANHVIYNRKEAKLTMVDLFYDDEDSRTDGRMKTCLGFDVIDDHFKGDWSYIQCALHDESVAKEVMRHLKQFIEAEHNWRVVRKSSRILNTVVIVSHPHGRPKLVTIGNISGIKLQNKEFGTIPGPFICSGNVQYTADTCPGSSGAPVLWLGMESNRGWKKPSGFCLSRCLRNNFWMFKLNINYILSVFVVLLTLFLSPIISGLLPMDRKIKTVINRTFGDIVIAFALWSNMLSFLRGSRSIFTVLCSKKLPYSIKYQKTLFRSYIKHCLTAIDFGSTFIINLLQVLFLLQVSMKVYNLETYWLSVAIFVICCTATLVLILLIYLLFSKLKYHLLRPLVLRPRVIWLTGCFIIFVVACILGDSYSIAGFQRLLLFFLFWIAGGDVILFVIQYLSFLSVRAFPKLFKKLPHGVLRTQTLSFIHSSGDENGNISYICIFR